MGSWELKTSMWKKNTIADENLFIRGRIVYRRGHVLSIHIQGRYSNRKPNETVNTIRDLSEFEHFCSTPYNVCTGDVRIWILNQSSINMGLQSTAFAHLWIDRWAGG